MSISINSAISAYNNAANITNGFRGNTPDKPSGSGANIFADMVERPMGASISNLRKAESLALGNLTKQADIADVVAAVTKAEGMLKTVVAVRDRLVGAFQELEKMPI